MNTDNVIYISPGIDMLMYRLYIADLANPMPTAKFLAIRESINNKLIVTYQQLQFYINS